MVECNRHQGNYLARQLEQAWGIKAIAWSLEEADAPPELPLVGTYFHASEMRDRGRSGRARCTLSPCTSIPR